MWKEDQLDGVFAEDGERLGTGVGFDGGIARVGEHLRQHQAERGFVIDYGVWSGRRNP